VLKVRNGLSYDRTVFHTTSRLAYTRLKDCSMNWYLGVLTIEGKKVEAEKPVLYVGTFGAGGASGATGYRTKRKEVASICAMRPPPLEERPQTLSMG
jgi:hypothetical protein